MTKRSDRPISPNWRSVNEGYTRLAAFREHPLYTTGESSVLEGAEAAALIANGIHRQIVRRRDQHRLYTTALERVQSRETTVELELVSDRWATTDPSHQTPMTLPEQLPTAEEIA